MNHLHSDIAHALSLLDDAKQRVASALASVQATCKHEAVLHSKWRASDWGPAFKARRLCLCCGLEEEALHSGWGDGDGDFTYLKTKGFHKIVDAHEIYRSRIPGASINANEAGNASASEKT